MHPDMQTLKTKTNFKTPLNFSITETADNRNSPKPREPT